MSWPLLGTLPPLYPEWLGERAFLEVHGLRFAYMGGSMARGIATTDLVIALAEIDLAGPRGKSRALASFGAPRSAATARTTASAWAFASRSAPPHDDATMRLAHPTRATGKRNQSAVFGGGPI